MYSTVGGTVAKTSLTTMGERGVLAILKERGTGCVAYSPLGRGFLSGQINSIDDLPVYTIINALLSRLPATAYDERVTKIVEYIWESYFEQDITPQTFADMVHLSSSRLTALFKEQTGSSMSKYLLWTRLSQVIYLTLSDQEKSLTDIAYDTGFYDLRQLSKYMYEMFGMP